MEGVWKVPFRKGYLKALISLVNNDLLSITDAAKEADISEEKFCRLLQADKEKCLKSR